jgi:hypothetical protein
MVNRMATVVQIPANRRATRDAAVLRRAADQITNPALADLIITLAAHLTRQYIEKLIADNRLPATRKPGSRHKLIAVSDLVEFEKNRRTATQRVAVLVNDLIDAGVEY